MWSGDLHEGAHSLKVFSQNENNTVYLCNLQIQSKLVGKICWIYIHNENTFSQTWYNIKLKGWNKHTILCTHETSSLYLHELRFLESLSTYVKWPITQTITDNEFRIMSMSILQTIETVDSKKKTLIFKHEPYDVDSTHPLYISMPESYY